MMPCYTFGRESKRVEGLLVAVHTWSSAARGAARKLQIINYLTKIRVGKTTTLKMPKSLIYSRIRVALYAGCSVFCGQLMLC